METTIGKSDRREKLKFYPTCGILIGLGNIAMLIVLIVSLDATRRMDPSLLKADYYRHGRLWFNALFSLPWLLLLPNANKFRRIQPAIVWFVVVTFCLLLLAIGFVQFRNIPLHLG